MDLLTVFLGILLFLGAIAVFVLTYYFVWKLLNKIFGKK